MTWAVRSALLSPARASVAGPTRNGDHATDLFLASVKLVVGGGRANGASGYYVGAGPALLIRGRDLFREDGSRTDFGGAIGAGVRLGVAPRLSLRLDGEDYLYRGDFDGAATFQNDVILSAGLSIAF